MLGAGSPCCCAATRPGRPGLPATPELPETGNRLSRTQETLHFSVARRLAERHGGRLTSWNSLEGRCRHASRAAGVTHPPGAALPRRRPGLRGVVLLLPVLASVAGAALLGVERHVEAERRDAEAAAFMIAAAGAEAAAQHVARILEWVETLHDLCATLWDARAGELRADTELLGAHLNQLVAEGRVGVRQVAAIDANGRLGWTTIPNALPEDLSDRKQFRLHREGRTAALVGAPRLDHDSGRWSLLVSRPVIGRGDVFLGVVVVALDPLALSRDLADLRVIEGAFATVVRPDGRILARSLDPQRFLGSQAPASVAALAQGLPQGRFRVPADLGGTPRLVAFRQVPGHELSVGFALPVDGVEGAVARLRRLLRAAVLAGTVAVGATGLFVLAIRARAAERAETAREEARRRRAEEVLEALPGAAYRGLVDAEGRFLRLFVSSAIARMTGFPAASFAQPGSIRALMDAEAMAGREAFFRRVRASGEALVEHRLRTADGRRIWVREHCRLVGPVATGAAEVVGLMTDITGERRLQASAMAAAKLATLGEMATGIAHELNQPCATIPLARRSGGAGTRPAATPPCCPPRRGAGSRRSRARPSACAA